MAKDGSSLDKLLLHHSHRRIEYSRRTSHMLHGFPCDCPGCLQTQTSSHMHHIQTIADWYLLLWYLSLESRSGINQCLGLLSSRSEEVLNPCGFSLCVSSGPCQTWKHFHKYPLTLKIGTTVLFGCHKMDFRKQLKNFTEEILAESASCLISGQQCPGMSTRKLMSPSP